jgi:hypothetical protein
MQRISQDNSGTLGTPTAKGRSRWIRAIRLSSGILLASVGLFVVIGCIELLVQAEDLEEWGSWIAGALVVAGLTPLGLSVLLLRPCASHPSARVCPGCGIMDYVQAGVLLRHRNWLLLHLIGFPLVLLVRGSQRKQVRCAACDRLFFVETRGNRTAAICLWVVLTFFLLVAVANQFVGK